MFNYFDSSITIALILKFSSWHKQVANLTFVHDLLNGKIDCLVLFFFFCSKFFLKVPTRSAVQLFRSYYDNNKPLRSCEKSHKNNNTFFFNHLDEGRLKTYTLISNSEKMHTNKKHSFLTTQIREQFKFDSKFRF